MTTRCISVVIPTWNGKNLLIECLKSLDAQVFPECEIVVVDDGSTDGTAEFILDSRELDNVTLVALPENSGFCAAVNAGLKRTHSELILVLNNDMTLEPDFVAKLVRAADTSDADMFAPLVLWRDDPSTIYSAGDRQLVNGRPESIGFRCPLDGFAFPDAIFGVSAGAALYRRDVFACVNLLDESFVAYFEDSDLSFRARLAGLRAEFVRDAVAYHVGSASLSDRTWWRARQCYRNHALLVVKNMPARLLLRHGRAILAERWHQMGRLFSAARAEFGAARAAAVTLEACGSMLRALPHALRERRRIQKSRAIDIEELDALLTKDAYT
ncbi:MAG TPA: glycosyltransferase family 2 protein [Candidatus Hydrogenedentes bacterium]|nr:glycosyltransferase family 2 protein [Candidatus Hydrogenedentota bacterium]